MLHYILQTIAFQVLFLIIYDLFLKNETFFNCNRAYLIATTVLSFILPFLKFESLKAMVPEPMVIRLPEVIIGDVTPSINEQIVNLPAVEISSHATSFSWGHLWIAGMVLAALILIYKLIKISRMYYSNPQRWQGDIQVIEVLDSRAAFSFFHYVFLGDKLSSQEKAHIVRHEMVHAKEKHSLDLLAFEMLRIVFWFNPLIYIYQNKLSILHEFIADAKAIKHHNKADYSQNLLSQVFETQNISFINPFFNSSLTRLKVFGKQFSLPNGQVKKRIVMLSKSKSKQIRLVKYALLVPMVLAMLMYTSSYARKIKDPFPIFQKQSLPQELTLPELVDKYYQEIEALAVADSSLREVFRVYSKNSGSYIQSKDELAKNLAFTKYLMAKIKRDKKVDSEAEKDEAMPGAGLKYTTYDEYLAYRKTDEAKRNWENRARDGELRLVVDDMKNLTAAEKEAKEKKIALINKDDFYHKLHMTDGVSAVITDFGQKQKTVATETSDVYDVEVPYAVIEDVPLYEGCEPSGSKDDDKQCTSNQIASFVNKNFNTNLATELGLEGKQRISVIFKIDTNGKIKEVKARAPHPALEAEAIRVIESMPDFTPGKQKGKAVTVPYSLPILFQVSAKVSDDEPIQSATEEKAYLENLESVNKKNLSNATEIPYAVVDEVPVFPSCESLNSNDERKTCTSNMIQTMINDNFNVQVAKDAGLKGSQRITAVFKIDQNGEITAIKARAKHLALETEIVRVIETLPKMHPGKQNGKPVVVSFSLPIIFQVK